MDFLIAMAEVLFEVLPERVAAALCTAITATAGIIGVVWYKHEAAQIAVCNSMSGRLGQLMNGSSMAGCGLASIFKVGGAILAGGGFLVCAVFVCLWIYLLAHPGKKLFD